MKILAWILGIGAVGLLFFIPIAIFIFGFHYNTGSGNHIGYVAAVEKNGLIFKTGRAYFKTDAQSSQEDSYCVMDDSVMSQLKDVAEKKEKVEISYFSWFGWGIANCATEDAAISAVKVLD